MLLLCLQSIRNLDKLESFNGSFWFVWFPPLITVEGFSLSSLSVEPQVSVRIAPDVARFTTVMAIPRSRVLAFLSRFGEPPWKGPARGMPEASQQSPASLRPSRRAGGGMTPIEAKVIPIQRNRASISGFFFGPELTRKTEQDPKQAPEVFRCVKSWSHFRAEVVLKFFCFKSGAGQVSLDPARRTIWQDFPPESSLFCCRRQVPRVVKRGPRKGPYVGFPQGHLIDEAM